MGLRVKNEAMEMYKKIQRLALARALNVPLEYLVDDALDDPLA